MVKIYQEDVSSFILELHEYVLHYNGTWEEDESFDHLQEFIEQRFDKFWPHLYDGEYKNYN